MASLLRRMSSRKEKISEPEAPPTPAADEDDGRVNVRAYNKKVGCPLPPNPHTTPPRFAPPPASPPRTSPTAQTGEVTIMRVQKGTPMGEVFKHYAERKGVAENSLTFARRRRFR